MCSGQPAQRQRFALRQPMAKLGHGKSENRLHAIEFADHLTVRALITRSRSPGVVFVDLVPAVDAAANLNHGGWVIQTQGTKQCWAPADRSVHRETPQMRRTQPGSQNCGLWGARLPEPQVRMRWLACLCLRHRATWSALTKGGGDSKRGEIVQV